MCMSCGCKQPNEDHGDKRHITLKDLEAAAQASEITADEAAKNISEACVESVGKQPVAAGVAGQTTGGQETGANAQRVEDRQGGYGSGSSGGPQ